MNNHIFDENIPPKTDKISFQNCLVPYLLTKHHQTHYYCYLSNILVIHSPCFCGSYSGVRKLWRIVLIGRCGSGAFCAYDRCTICTRARLSPAIHTAVPPGWNLYGDSAGLWRDGLDAGWHYNVNTVDFGYKGLSLMRDNFSGPFVQVSVSYKWHSDIRD